MNNPNRVYVPTQSGGANRYKGERHAPLLVDGGVKIAEYMGPMTRIVERAKANVLPLNSIADLISAIHDCDYWLAQLAPNKQEQLRLVRVADVAMLNRLSLAQKKGLDNVVNISAGKIGIGAKVTAEKRGKIAGLLSGFSAGGPVGAAVGYFSGAKVKEKMNNIAGDLVKHPEEDIQLIRRFRKEKLNELDRKLGTVTGQGMCHRSQSSNVKTLNGNYRGSGYRLS